MVAILYLSINYIIHIIYVYIYIHSFFGSSNESHFPLFSINEYQAVESLDLKFITFSSQFY